MLKPRQIGRQQEFIHSLNNILLVFKESNLVVTTNPELLQKGLSFLGTNCEYTPVYEGLKGISLNDRRREKGYIPKVIGYKFKVTS